MTITVTSSDASGGSVKIDDGEAGASASKTVAKVFLIVLFVMPLSIEIRLLQLLAAVIVL